MSVKAGATRVALLGTGGIAELHARFLRAVPGIQLVAVCDVELSKARAFASKWRIPEAFGSCEELLEKARPDVVHVLLPPALHARYAIECMAGGADVFVEKPLCVSEAECRQLEEAAATYGRRVGVNHNVTFGAAVQELFGAIRSGRLGAVEHLSVVWSAPYGARVLGSPWYESRGPGVILLETGAHPLSLITRLAGEVESAAALVTAMGKHPDTWQVSFQCQRATAQLQIGVGRTFTDTRIHVVGEDGCAFVDLRLNAFGIVENTAVTGRWAPMADLLGVAGSFARSAGDAAGAWVRNALGLEKGDGGKGMADSIAAFHRALRAGRKPPVGLEEGIAVVRACLMAEAAAATEPETLEAVA